MNTYRVTLNFTFAKHYAGDEYSQREDALPNMTKKESKKVKREAYERTDAYYEEHNIEDYIKSLQSAMGFVETLWFDEEELLGAEWDAERFAIHMTIKTDKTPDEIRDELESNSLEDGEYEACGETGWLIFTRREGNIPWHGEWDVKDVWEYGLTDYRDNPIDVVKVEEPPRVDE